MGKAHVRQLALCGLWNDRCEIQNGHHSSFGKLLWSETRQRMAKLAMQIQGPCHQLVAGSQWVVDGGVWQHAFLRSIGHTIEAGTSEIQRNIIGERVLGLPKDVARASVPEGR